MSKAIVKFSSLLHTKEVVVDSSSNTIFLNDKKFTTEQTSLDAPISGTVYGTILNYKGELEALGTAVNEAPYKQPPKAPVLYIKPINTIIGFQKPIPLPSNVSNLQIGAALGVVIGKNATNVSEKNALEYVAGYTIVNDVSVPHDSVYRPAISQKSRDGFCPVGPWVIERDAIADPNQLSIQVFINGELKQQNTTANLIRPVSQLISEITSFMTLYEGDTLLVGVPENPPLVNEGDLVRIEIEGIGSLENKVKPEVESLLKEEAK
ncbi:fumarylacetoacetate hydrolase family protein [Metabacillus sediminilitoris]|uniref:4-hydroxyphenylacetate isomerase n=1 Tax=Metabacillus sediminilitoris TaxID=2567941 RepID=A0A4V3WF43_9BACI|nr:fumarylacetoacetate hydrolase family protein [Metabacillus sediminilitoris]QGQ44809.1 4-hydroxyphenylacetate isomerase [Metabacillus sediminilitoris]THF78843.1 4-hydroxyphenylacetate isomerase [Metabacillus sediminilitoris]